ncbi:MAG: hypothetical protein JW904_09685 [Spirochaetales bacterium]|nr:hypothetical protein [Spirochaetales bacterium]
MKKAVFLLIVSLLAVSVLFADEAPDFDSVFRIIAEKLAAVEKRLPNKTIAVYGFDVIGRPGDSYGRYATEKLTHEIVNEGSFLVIERTRIDEVIKEQSFSLSDIVDASTAARIGKVLSVDAVIIGTILVTDERTEFIVRAIGSERGIILASVAEYVAAGTQSAKDGDKPIKDVFTVTTAKKVYSSDENINIEYSGFPGNDQDWITLVKSGDSDKTYGEWFYTEGKKSGSYTFGKVKPGEYEIRVYFDWPAGGYVVQTRIQVTVK